MALSEPRLPETGHDIAKGTGFHSISTLYVLILCNPIRRRKSPSQPSSNVGVAESTCRSPKRLLPKDIVDDIGPCSLHAHRTRGCRPSALVMALHHSRVFSSSCARAKRIPAPGLSAGTLQVTGQVTGCGAGCSPDGWKAPMARTFQGSWLGVATADVTKRGKVQMSTIFGR